MTYVTLLYSIVLGKGRRLVMSDLQHALAVWLALGLIVHLAIIEATAELAGIKRGDSE